MNQTFVRELGPEHVLSFDSHQHEVDSERSTLSKNWRASICVDIEKHEAETRAAKESERDKTRFEAVIEQPEGDQDTVLERKSLNHIFARNKTIAKLHFVSHVF